MSLSIRNRDLLCACRVLGLVIHTGLGYLQLHCIYTVIVVENMGNHNL
jgi:hypothetical protein